MCAGLAGGRCCSPAARTRSCCTCTCLLAAEAGTCASQPQDLHACCSASSRNACVCACRASAAACGCGECAAAAGMWRHMPAGTNQTPRVGVAAAMCTCLPGTRTPVACWRAHVTAAQHASCWRPMQQPLTKALPCCCHVRRLPCDALYCLVLPRAAFVLPLGCLQPTCPSSHAQRCS
jgi:hypothetical protein